MGSKKLSIALIQLAVSSNKEVNIKRACQLVSSAAENGAELICLPECFNSPYGIQYFRQYAESIPGETSKALSECAKHNKIYLVGGSCPEKFEDKIYNTCLVYGPDGELLAKYRKLHLFDINIPGKITFKESTVLSAGNELTTFKMPQLTVGLGICYDIRFPIIANIYAERGCHLLLYPGAFNMTTGPAHWESLGKARALDNQLFVATVSPARDETASYVAWGHSMLVDPWGKVVAQADEKEKTIYGTIDLQRLNEVREQIPILKQARNDMYGLVDKMKK